MADQPALGFKQLTAENWGEQDPVMRHFVGLSGINGKIKRTSADDWATYFLAVSLHAGVPLDVRALFEVARGV